MTQSVCPLTPISWLCFSKRNNCKTIRRSASAKLSLNSWHRPLSDAYRNMYVALIAFENKISICGHYGEYLVRGSFRDVDRSLNNWKCSEYFSTKFHGKVLSFLLFKELSSRLFEYFCLCSNVECVARRENLAWVTMGIWYFTFAKETSYARAYKDWDFI